MIVNHPYLSHAPDVMILHESWFFLFA